MIQVLRLIYDSGGTHHPAVVVYENISHDSENPAFEVDVLTVLFFIIKHLESGVLKQIVSIVAVRSKDIREVEQIVLKRH